MTRHTTLHSILLRLHVSPVRFAAAAAASDPGPLLQLQAAMRRRAA
jgi:hypothetical protein